MEWLCATGRSSDEDWPQDVALLRDDGRLRWMGMCWTSQDLFILKVKVLSSLSFMFSPIFYVTLLSSFTFPYTKLIFSASNSFSVLNHLSHYSNSSILSYTNTFYWTSHLSLQMGKLIPLCSKTPIWSCPFILILQYYTPPRWGALFCGNFITSPVLMPHKKHTVHCVRVIGVSNGV